MPVEHSIRAQPGRRAENLVHTRSGGVDAVQRIWRGAGGTVLQPAAWLFGALTRTRTTLYARGILERAHAGVPTISVGNLMVGGSGKTPVSGWLLDQLLTRGRKPALLHVGNAQDEPMLHRLWRPDVGVFSGRDRMRNAKRAIADGCDVIVLDDGFQHQRLLRDLDVVLISAETWRWPHRLLPAGAWREPLSAARRAQVIAITRKSANAGEAAAIADTIRRALPDAAILQIALEPDGWMLWRGGAAGQRVSPRAHPHWIVTGIAHPESFVAQVQQSGVVVEGVIAFPDHHDYTPDDLREIEALTGGGAFMTTEKDAVKLGSIAPAQPLLVLRQRVTIEQGLELLEKQLDRVLA